MEYTVRLDGRLVKKFKDQTEARKFMVEFIELQKLYQKQFDYIDEAVLQSDLNGSKQVIKHIMEMR
jgi:hypothetical protein